MEFVGYKCLQFKYQIHQIGINEVGVFTDSGTTWSLHFDINLTKSHLSATTNQQAARTNLEPMTTDSPFK